MTSELQKAMACYEEARGRYRVAILASLRGAARGDVIRRAIRECQAAGDDVRRLTSLSSRVTAVATRHSEQPSPTATLAETRASTG
jgi:hypothetical protein